MRSCAWILPVFLLACATGLVLGAVDQPRPSAGFRAEWVGQTGADRTSLGPAVGPDGFQDVQIRLTQLAPKVNVKAIRVEGPAKRRWEFGTNPTLLPSAELIRRAEPSTGDLYFQPERDLSGQQLKLIVAYENDQFESAVVSAGACDPRLATSQSPLPVLSEGTLKVTWLGQDGTDPRALGDVHVVVDGLPAASLVAGLVLTDSVRGTWTYRSAGSRRGTA